MNEEVESDVEFFPQDFTTATDFEIFTARLTQFFEEWTLKNQFADSDDEEIASNKNWKILNENLHFADFELVLTKYSKVTPKTGVFDANVEADIEPKCFTDLMDSSNDFSNLESHPVADFYGLSEFIVLKPQTAVQNESQLKLLMSSIHMAANESTCEIPVFVHALEFNRNIYLGVCNTPQIRCSFDIVHLLRVPHTLKTIPGLLEMFKGKIGVQYQDLATISARLKSTYIKTNQKSVESQEMYDSHAATNFLTSKFGVLVNPLESVSLFQVWPEVSENVCQDICQEYEINFEFLHSMQVKFEESPVCPSADVLSEYLQCSESKRTLFEFVGNLALEVGLGGIEGNPLHQLTESKIPILNLGLPDIKLQKNGVQTYEGPIRDYQLQEFLYYLFPDADPVKANEYKIIEPEPFDPLKIKSAPVDSLVVRLSSLLSICNAFHEGKAAIAQLFAEFASELRYRVERCIQIPGVAAGFPDSKTCLLHQKLQMLNICMDRRRVREGGLPFAMAAAASSSNDGGQDSESEEFFDLSDNEEDKFKHELWNEPIGRLTRLGKMLLVNSDEPVYIPVTQEPVPKTEDELEDDAEVMLKLGASSELRQQMMSASLLSDMESFKAANPSAVFEDFIRWYSPRDWLDENPEESDPFGRKGHLSERMLIEGNTWQSVWKTARPVPAHRQKRLFDDTKEAEKVLNFFESVTIGQICQLTIPVLFHSALLKIKKETRNYVNCIPNFEDNYNRAIVMCCKLSRENWSPMPRGISTKKWEGLLNDIHDFEYNYGKAEYLYSKLFGQHQPVSSDKEAFITALLIDQQVTLPELLKKEIYDSRYQLIDESDQCMIEKQVILRVSGKTVSKGDQGPQFLKAILRPNEMRLCGAFSKNIIFM